MCASYNQAVSSFLKFTCTCGLAFVPSFGITHIDDGEILCCSNDPRLSLLSSTYMHFVSWISPPLKLI